jgi:hypothetical protein
MTTKKSLELFLNIARIGADESYDWGYTVPLSYVGGDPKERRGNLTQLKKEGLITTWQESINDGEFTETWIEFTDEGQALAARHGFEVHTFKSSHGQ